MIDSATVNVNFIKKEAFTGSDTGMRYRLEKADEEILATVWPEPFNFVTTDDSLKTSARFPLSVEGKDEAVKWLNEMHEANIAQYTEAMNKPLTESFKR